MVPMNRFAGKKLRHRCREQTYGHQSGKAVGGWGAWWCCFHENSLLKYSMIQESAQIINTGLSKLSKVNTPE